MRLLVCGGRYYNDHATLDYILSRYYYQMSLVIHGACPSGADHLADAWCRTNGLPILPFPAKWKQYKKKAGPLRNTQMIVEGKPDMVLAFPGGTGTHDLIRQATTHSIPVITL